MNNIVNRISSILFLFLFAAIVHADQNEQKIENYRNSVVMVTTTGIEAKRGTGFFLEQDLIATCLHVVTGSSEVQIEFKPIDGNNIAMTGHVVIRKPSADLAVIQIDKPIKGTIVSKLSDTVSAGEELLVIGYPIPRILPTDSNIALRKTGYKKIHEILNPEMTRKLLSTPLLSKDTILLDIEGGFIPGHSGSPLFNDKGEIVGMADGGMQNKNVSWAISSQEFKDILDTKYKNIPDLNFFDRIKINMLMADEFIDRDDKTSQIKIGNWEFKKIRVSQNNMALDNTTSGKLYNAFKNYVKSFSKNDYSNGLVNIYGENIKNIYFAFPFIEQVEFDDYIEPFEKETVKYGIRAELLKGDMFFDLSIVEQHLKLNKEDLSTKRGLILRKLMQPSASIIEQEDFSETYKNCNRIVHSEIGFSKPSQSDSQYELFHIIIQGNGITAELALLDKNRVDTLHSLKREKIWAKLILSSLFLFISD